MTRKVPVIGLVGGIGSGKSFLARQLLARGDGALVDADDAGHQVLKDQQVRQEIRQAFGEQVFTPAGDVDRRKVGSLVFGSSPSQRRARTTLESIVHPRITEILKQQITQLRAQPGVEWIILDAAILLETGWKSLCDVVVFVETRFQERLARVRRGRGWSEAELKLREESQFPLERKRKEAGHVVDNSRDTAVALAELEKIVLHAASQIHA